MIFNMVQCAAGWAALVQHPGEGPFLWPSPKWLFSTDQADSSTALSTLESPQPGSREDLISFLNRGFSLTV